MSLIYSLANLATSGLSAIQAEQRDYSPFLVHFTSCACMKTLRSDLFGEDLYTRLLTGKGQKPLKSIAEEVAKALQSADEESFSIVQKIFSQEIPVLKKSSPKPEEGIPECVCLSQCTLPGLLGHTERFGRFGFVFDAKEIFQAGGRPALYVDNTCYGRIDACANADVTDCHTPQCWADIKERLWPYVNVLQPPGNGGRVQDFTVEREWRILEDINLEKYLKAVLTPDAYVEETRRLLPATISVPILPIDMLYRWGI